MIQLVLDDSHSAGSLYPFTATRSAADIRIGILTIRQKWERLLGIKVRVYEDAWLETPLPQDATPVTFAASIVPSAAFIQQLQSGTYAADGLLKDSSVRVLQFPWEIFQFNDWAIREDFVLITANRRSAPVPPTVQLIGPSAALFIEEGARLQHCFINTSTGPVYIGKNSEIMEGSTIRGPFALCEEAVVKMGTRIYGATTIGPSCVVGGEIKNSILFGYSNKGHDGYLGDAVIGEWCNLGAGTSNSNLKNTAGNVKVWHAPAHSYVDAGMKCGLLMGDYSRAGINTSFNTGTVVGVCANIAATGIPPKYVPDFSWLVDVSAVYEFEKALKDIGNWKKLKNQSLGEKEIQRLQHIFERRQTQQA
jgi:UDP-N-acetylglucosamine diphosphorylase/glucosamine-1-phosphate N-acetyltransferase